MDINEKYSYGDFTHKQFLDVDPDEFSNSEIVGACFYQEVLYSADASHPGSSGHVDTLQDVFPAGMHSVTFRDCNLDNCKIPGPPTQLIRCSHRKIRVMNDREDWVLGSDNKPVEPVSKKLFIQMEISIDPADIGEELRDRAATARPEN